MRGIFSTCHCLCGAGSGIAGYFRQTGDSHLAVSCNERYNPPLDGRPLFAENCSLISALLMSTVSCSVTMLGAEGANCAGKYDLSDD